jgi:uncharacterized cupredoxin-like copper-binding protein
VKRTKLLFLILGSTAVMACGAGPAADYDAEAGSETAASEVSAEAEEVREVVVTMSEYEFVSSTTTFTVGVPYRFVFINEGDEEHEWAVVPHGETDEANLLFEVEEEELPSGATLIREFIFPEPGEYDFACFLPGHYEGGMVLPVTVE